MIAWIAAFVWYVFVAVAFILFAAVVGDVLRNMFQHNNSDRGDWYDW